MPSQVGVDGLPSHQMRPPTCYHYIVKHVSLVAQWGLQVPSSCDLAETETTASFVQQLSGVERRETQGKQKQSQILSND